jgi:predicted aspartyl protease
MIRYQYAAEISPPAPFVQVTVRNPTIRELSVDLPAQLDTGADRTVVPSHIIDQLQLTAVRAIPIAGLGGERHHLEVFVLRLQVHDLSELVIEVLAHDDELFVLLGRDVLNHFRILLDGPNKILEIG